MQISNVDSADRSAGRAKYASDNKLMEAFERKKMRVRKPNERAAVDSWLEWVGKFPCLDKDLQYKTEVRASGEHFYSTVFGRKVLTVHNDTKYLLGKAPGYFMTVSRPELR